MVGDEHGTAEQGRRPGTNIAFAMSFFRVVDGRRQRRRMVRQAGAVDRRRVTAVCGRRKVLVVPFTVARRLERVVFARLPMVTPRRVRNGRRCGGDVIGLLRLYFLRFGVGFVRAPKPPFGAPQHGACEACEAIRRSRGGVPLRRLGGVLTGRLAALIKSQVVVGLFACLDEEGRDEQPEE